MTALRPRVACLATLLALAAPLVGCRGPQPSAPTVPQQQVFSTRPVVLAPDRNWERTDDGRWSFRGTSSLWLWVESPLDEGLVVELASDGANPDAVFTAVWDAGEPLVERLQLPPEGAFVAVPAALATPGAHELRLRRRYSLEERTRPLDHAVGLRRLAVRVAGERHPVPPADRESLTLFADFLSLGVAGTGTGKRSGVLFIGPQARAVEASGASGGTLDLVAENGGRRPATFQLTVGGASARVEVAGGAAEPLQLRWPSGETTARFEVTGGDEGPFLFGSPWISTVAPEPRTPIVLITLDTTRRDALGPFGGPPKATPHLNAFAAEATVFERAFTTAPWTLPSHASMMTGLFPSQHGVGVSRTQLERDQDSAAQRLRDAGYLAAGFVGGRLCASEFGLGRGFHHFEDPPGAQRRGDELTRAARAFVRRHHEQPLFLFVNFFDPHQPYAAPAAFQRRAGVPAARDRLDPATPWGRFARGKGGVWQRILEGEVPLTEAGRSYVETSYMAEVAFLDEQVGRLLASLRRYDLYQRALIVVLADHGELLGERDTFGHSGRPYPPVTDIPMIVKFPGQTRGTRVSDLVSAVDVFPTLLAPLGSSAAPTPRSAAALGPTGRGGGRRPFVLIEEHESRVHPLSPLLRVSDHAYVVQRPDFRQLVWQGGAECLRRQGEGWGEAACATDSEAVLAALEALLGPRAADAPDAGVVPAEMAERLAALGYL